MAKNPSGLVITLSDASEGPVFERFFAGYDRAFVLPDEKEDIEGLKAALDLNHDREGAALAARYGPFRELCLIADDEDGTPVGGANFIAMPARSAPGVVTANLSYIYVDPEARGRGNLRRLVAAVRDAIAQVFAGTHGLLTPLIFLEQNDPLAMSPEAYARDTEFTGLDQLDRLRIWSRLGARLIDFPYVQPPLSAQQEPDDALLYSVLGATGQSLDPRLLRDHLAGFFGISVLKGIPLDQDPTADRTMNSLDALAAAGKSIELLDPDLLLRAVCSRDDVVRKAGDLASFRALVRANASESDPQ
jgi:GNAT superfamily N-acetyltransferase